MALSDRTYPTVNINGMSREDLIKHRREAMTAVQAAMVALIPTQPHGRDYIPNPDRYETDRAIYRARYDALYELHKALEGEALSLYHGGDK
jgi:hypothetical protein